MSESLGDVGSIEKGQKRESIRVGYHTVVSACGTLCYSTSPYKMWQMACNDESRGLFQLQYTIPQL